MLLLSSRSETAISLFAFLRPYFKFPTEIFGEKDVHLENILPQSCQGFDIQMEYIKT